MTVYEKCAFGLVYWFYGILEILLVQIQSLFWVSDSKLYNIIKNRSDIDFNFLQCTVIYYTRVNFATLLICIDKRTNIQQKLDN